MRDTSRPVPFLPAARGIFELSLDAMVWSRRTLMMALLLGLPIVFALIYRFGLDHASQKLTGFDLYGVVVAVYYIRNVLPLAALFYATSLIADEVEGKTLTYLLTRPIQRASILAGKFAAYVVTTLCLTLPVTVITFFLLVTGAGLAGMGATVPDLFRDLGAIALTLVSYGALFTLLGVLLRRPVIPGLLFLFIWELVANLPGYLPRFTLTAWLRSLVHHRPAQEGLADLFGEVLPLGESLAVLAVVTTALLALAFWIFSRREYVMGE